MSEPFVAEVKIVSFNCAASIVPRVAARGRS